MDPDSNIREQLQVATRIVDAEIDGDQDTIRQDALRLAELVHALDEWMSKGGFLPTRWAGK